MCHAILVPGAPFHSCRVSSLPQFRLGLFDPASKQPYRQIPPSVVDSHAHQQLALDAARQGMVLLRNDNGALPFADTIKNVVVVGPNGVWCSRQPVLVQSPRCPGVLLRIERLVALLYLATTPPPRRPHPQTHTLRRRAAPFACSACCFPGGFHSCSVRRPVSVVFG